jgi:hypothetical protein
METPDSIATDPIRALTEGRTPLRNETDLGHRVIRLLERLARHHPLPKHASNRSVGQDAGQDFIGRYMNPEQDARAAVAELEVLANQQRDEDSRGPWILLRRYADKLSPGARVRDMDANLLENCLRSLVRNQV